MMDDGETKAPNDSAPRRKNLSRKRILLLFALAVLVGAFFLVRVGLRAWMHSRLLADAPRIAFSLDNTLLAQAGITDTAYEQAMLRAGGYLVTLRPDMAGSPHVDPTAVENFLEDLEIDGVFLTGGGDVDPAIYGGETDKTILVHRLRDDFEIALIRAAANRDLPILGICRGCQILNVAFGGTLRNLRLDDKLMKRHLSLSGHSVDISPGSTLAQIFGTTHFDHVISLHGQAVDTPGDGVTIVARDSDGVAEAIEVRPGGLSAWIIGIQWHPELALTDDVQNEYFNAFVEQAREMRKRRIIRKLDREPYQAKR